MSRNDPSLQQKRRAQVAAYNRRRDRDALQRSAKARLILIAFSPLVLVPVYTLVEGPSVEIIVGIPALILACLSVLWGIAYVVRRLRRRDSSAR